MSPPKQGKKIEKSTKKGQKNEDEAISREFILESAIVELNCDIIGDKFWNDYPYLLNPKVSNNGGGDQNVTNKG